MKVVTLVSGGLDSTVMSVLIKEEGMDQFPLFVDYGQINLDRERAACLSNFDRLGLPVPTLVPLQGYGRTIPSGLTNPQKHIVNEAFLPGRNLLFLLCAAAHAFQCDANAVAIGFLDETLSLFPDQTRKFAAMSEEVLCHAMGRRIQVLTPLIGFRKADVLALADAKGIRDTYSCHAGTSLPCGRCIACREYEGLEVEHGRK